MIQFIKIITFARTPSLFNFNNSPLTPHWGLPTAFHACYTNHYTKHWRKMLKGYFRKLLRSLITLLFSKKKGKRTERQLAERTNDENTEVE